MMELAQLKGLDHPEVLEISQQIDELHLAGAGIHRHVGRRRAVGVGVRMVGEDLLHRHGEGLVERGVVAHVHHLVRKLVEYEARELCVRIADEGREQRIVEPAERRVRGYAADEDVVACKAQLLRVLARFAFRKESPVAHAAGEGKALLPRLGGVDRR
jgi:hypothetical protein